MHDGDEASAGTHAELRLLRRRVAELEAALSSDAGATGDPVRYVLAAVLQDAATLAHELKSPMTGIHMALQVLAGQLGEDHEAILRDLVGRLQGLEGMVRRVLAAAEPPRLRRRACDPVAIFVAATARLRELLERAAANVELQSTVEPFTFLADPARLEQALAALLADVVEAAGEGVRLRLGAHRAGDVVVLAIECDRHHVSAESHTPVEAPRAADDDTGLRLAVCRGIVAQHGGKIEPCTSGLGGAAFRIVLPACGPETTPSPPGSVPDPGIGP